MGLNGTAQHMAEPRKPRVIRTRPGTIPPLAIDPALSDTAASNPQPSEQAQTELVGEAGAAVRSTSNKVSVVPVPKETVQNEPVSNRPVRKVRGSSSSQGADVTPEPVAVDTASKGRKWKALILPVWRRRPGRTVPVEDVNGDAAGSSGELGEQDAKVLVFPVPSHRRRRRNVLLGAASVLAVLALVMGVALFSPVLAVQKVTFDGQELIGEDVLQKAVAPILARPLPQVNEEEVQDLLAAVVQVKSSRIEARPPSTLLVHIVERVPVALLKNGANYLLVDQEGVQIGSTKDPKSAALPLIDGGKAAIGKDTFRAVTAVLANLPKSILVQMANASAKSPDAVELKLADGRRVIWGNASDMELKAEVLGALLNARPPTPEPGKPETVPARVFDVSAPRHPVTR